MGSSSLVVFSAVFLAYAALSGRLHGTPITAPIVFVGAGFLFGPEGLGWLHLTFDQHSISLLAEATLAVVLFTDASRIDLRALRHGYAVPARLLGIGLPLTIVAGTVVGALVLPNISWAEAAVLAIVLAPTDAALGQAVVTDERVPSRIREALNVESGLNDGMCVPLLTIALAIAQTEAHDTTGVHALRLVVEAIGWGIVGGVVAGALAAGVQRAAASRGWIDRHWLQIVPVIGAVGSFGIADSRGGSGFIAAFVGGVVFGFAKGADVGAAQFSEELGEVLNGVTLMVFGAVVLEHGVVADRARRVRLRGVEPHAGADGPGRARDARLPCRHADGAVPRLVRSPRARVDRVRRRRGGGLGVAAHVRARRRPHGDGRAERRRPRRHRRPAGSTIRTMARGVRVADGEHAGNAGCAGATTSRRDTDE